MQLSVLGLDHVGAAVAGCLAAQGHRVVAVDPDANKVAMIRRAAAPGDEPGLSRLLEEAVGAQRLQATTSLGEAVAQTALTSICEGTTDRHGHPDLSQILSLCEALGGALRAKPRFHALAFRSALRPGTLRDVVIPTLERVSAKRAGAEFGIAVYPQFLRRGSAIEDYFNPPAIVLGVTDGETLARLREMDIALEAREMVMALDQAEALLQPDRRAPLPPRAAEPVWPARPALA